MVLILFLFFMQATLIENHQINIGLVNIWNHGIPNQLKDNE